jgi:Uma2 family endonuclease
MSALERPRYTPEQYLERERKAAYKSEYLHGEIFAMAGGSPRHALIMGNISGVLFAPLKGSGCKAYSSDLRLHVNRSSLYTYPDVTVVCGEPTIVQIDNLVNPTVIFEVLSPSSEDFDRGEKFAYYRTLESLRDYVLVAQDKCRVEHYWRVPEGEWPVHVARALDESITLRSIDCALPLSEIYDGVVFNLEMT